MKHLFYLVLFCYLFQVELHGLSASTNACPAPDADSLWIVYKNTSQVTYQYLGTGYREVQWRYRAITDTAWTALPGQSGAVTLGVDSPYEFSARGICANQELSDWSSSKPFVMPCTPLVPADLTIEYRGNGSVLFETNVPAKKYFWRYRIKGAVNWSPTIEREFGVLLLEQLKSDALYEFGLRIQCFNETIGNWLTVEYQMPCVKPVATDLSVSTTLESVTITYNKDNFTKLDWRYRIVGDTNAWLLHSGYSIGFGSPQQFLYEVQIRLVCPNRNISPWSETVKPLPFTQPDLTELSIEPLQAAKTAKLRISPNPSNGQVKMLLPQGLGEATIEVLNVAGQKVFSQKLDGFETSLDLSDQTSGLYFVRVQAGKQVFTERILLQKP